MSFEDPGEDRTLDRRTSFPVFKAVVSNVALRSHMLEPFQVSCFITPWMIV